MTEIVTPSDPERRRFVESVAEVVDAVETGHVDDGSGPGADAGAPPQDLDQQTTVVMTVLAQDPEVAVDGRPLTASLPVPAGRLQRGPTNHRFQVVDVTARGTGAKTPVLLHTAPWVYRDAWAGGVPLEAVGSVEFQAQNVFAVANHVLALFERHLGRRVPWRSGWPHLFLVPRGTIGPNAAYTPDKQAVVFGWLPALDDLPAVYTCLSYDVVAHEVTHAILDGLRPRYVEPGLPDQLAFHEALADIVAMLSVFGLTGIAERLLDPKRRGRVRFDSDRQVTRSDDVDQRRALRIADRAQELKGTALLGLAEELGRARRLRKRLPDPGVGKLPLRQSVLMTPDPSLIDDPGYREPHRRAEILVAAVMQTLVTMWAGRLDALDATRGLDVERVAEEGVRAAEHLIGMVLRSLDYLPPVELEFADVIDSIVTADKRLHPDDELGYRQALIEAFERFGIKPPAHRIVDEDGLVAPTPTAEGLPHSDADDPDAPREPLRYSHLNFTALRSSPEEVFAFIWNNAGALEIDVRLSTRVDRVLSTTRVGSDGLVVNEVLADYTQWIRTTADRLPAGMRAPEGMDPHATVALWGGGVLVFDQFGRFRLHQRKPILDVLRQQRRLESLVASQLMDSKGGFGSSDGVDPDERFGLLHGGRAEDSW